MTGSRNISSTNIAASSADVIHEVIFVKLEFDSGNVNLHSELGEISFGGDTYTGVGKLGSVSNSDEVSDLSAAPFSIGLSGLPNDLVSILFNEHYQGRRATIYIGYLDLTTRQLVDVPFIWRRGLIDYAKDRQGKTFAISLNINSRLSRWNTANVRRYNNATQQSRYPNDRGLQFIDRMANKTIVWGASQ
jgi:hypothetical protein